MMFGRNQAQQKMTNPPECAADRRKFYFEVTKVKDDGYEKS
jgi:hypothetical protein